jgi:peptide-methionine (S)-S-oxide reductase
VIRGFPPMFRFPTLPALLILTEMTSLTPSAKADSIVLGGGCFWCLDASYKLLPGVTHITCGYSGGELPNPSYEQVCTETTGHAEVVKVDFDPAKVSLERVLAYFWAVHDPTQVGGQGNDMGSQYRSIILYADDAQKAAAEKSRAQAQKLVSDTITTEIVPLKKFWPAEDYHQDYFAKHPYEGYCAVVIGPKVKKLKEMLSSGK